MIDFDAVKLLLHSFISKIVQFPHLLKRILLVKRCVRTKNFAIIQYAEEMPYDRRAERLELTTGTPSEGSSLF
jgi:hypothetical protein